MNSILRDNINEIHKLCQKYNVKNLFVFGSAINNEFNIDSDIDLLIEFNDIPSPDYAENFLEIAEAFEELFKKPVDLLTVKSLSNPILVESINKTKQQIYGKVG